YSNGEQAHRCEQQGILVHVPVKRAVNQQGDGALFDRSQFVYDEKTDTLRCPAGQTLTRKYEHKQGVTYEAPARVCGSCPLKAQCTLTSRRRVNRHRYEDALEQMQQRATPEAMRLRRSTV